MKKKEYTFQSNGCKITGTHYINQNYDNKIIVFLLTGDSPNGSQSKTWKPLIERLITEKMDVFIFDFCSQGLSSGDRKDLTLTVGEQNLRDAVKEFYSKNKNTYNKSGVIASSFGASVLLKAIQNIDIFGAIIFKSPAVNLATAYKNDIGVEEFEKWELNAICELTGLSFNAYKEALKQNLLFYSQKIKCPTLIIQGDMDEIVPIDSSIALAKMIGENASVEIIKGAKHNYKQEGALEIFIEKATQFLINQLGD